MSQSLITRAKDFTTDSISYGSPTTNKHGGKAVPILVDGAKLVLQFPFNFTWGAQANTDENSGRTSYSLNLVLDEGSALRETLTALQEKVVGDMVTFSKAWFGKTIQSREVVEALFYPVVRYPNIKGTTEPDTTRKPSLKAQLAEWDGVFKTELFDMSKRVVNGPTLRLDTDSFLAAIPTASHLSGLLECKGVWYSAGRCGVSWKLLQARVKPPVRIEGYCMVDDSDEEDAVAAIDEAADEAAELPSTEVAGADGEPEPEPEPEPTPKKKAARKRPVKKATAAADN